MARSPLLLGVLVGIFHRLGYFELTILTSFVHCHSDARHRGFALPNHSHFCRVIAAMPSLSPT